jgi:hypothetical protein
MHRLALAALAITLVGCASRPEPAPPPPAAPADPRPFLVRVADSTITLVAVAAVQSDSANVQARVALREPTPARVRYRIEHARLSAVAATRFVEAAIAQGDYIGEILPLTPGAGAETASYTKYWTLSRAKLDLARAKTSSAVNAADSALACSATGCAATRADQMQGYIEEAAGAAREAETLVRIANIYVAQAVKYVRSAGYRTPDTAGFTRRDQPPQ